jgi:SAM-dependent methyltransferase
MKGQLHKMRVSQDSPIKYFLELDTTFCMNDYIGKSITLSWSGVIQCVSCQKVTKSSFGQGFCYTCFTQSASAAECIIRPELCRAHLGEGRDIAWEEANHNQPHVVYLAQSDIVKVGVTRETQIPTRWIDQGAVAAIKVAETPNRYLAGVLEVALKDHFSDITLMDNSQEMINICLEKVEYHETENIHPIWFNLENTNFDGSFDIIYNQMVLHHVNDYVSIINTFYALLNPEGYLAIADLYPEDGSFHGIDVKVHWGFEPDQLVEILTKTGFKNISYKKCFEMPRESGRKYPIFLLTAQK